MVDNGRMDVTKRKHDERTMLRIPFTPDESSHFRAFRKATGRKAGPWVRTLILAAMDREEGRGDGSRQAQELAETFKGEGQGRAADCLTSEPASSGGQP
jgi:hypothetical protein